MSESQPSESAQPSPRRPLIAVFASHWLAMLGLGLVLTAIVLWLCLLPAQLRGGQDNPYVGVLTAGIGALGILGMVLTPIGLHLGRRRLAKRVADSLADRRTTWLRFSVFLLVVSLFNLAIASQVTLRVVHHMESRDFCVSCHVHVPEERSFDQGAHAGTLCVDCHVGDGTVGLLKSKLQGIGQLMSVVTDTVHVPVETAIERGLMIPAEETCEQCHWRSQPAGANLKLIQRYAEDESNTPETTLLTMNVGGTVMGGIHGSHHGEGIEIRFVANDPLRQDIPLVEYENSKSGVRRTYVKTGVDAGSLEHAPRITMQCFDCHNRPAHAFLMPDRAVDRALMMGRMSAELPFLKKKSLEILKATYETSAAAAAAIPAALASYYASDHPKVASERASDVAQAGEVLADIYSRNVFPELGVDWGTYPDNRGHQSFPGCFRCHDGEHADSSGEKITNNCFRCHYPASVSETKPEVLEMLGVDRLLKGLRKK